jgi:hypothetical protein
VRKMNGLRVFKALATCAIALRPISKVWRPALADEPALHAHCL